MPRATDCLAHPHACARVVCVCIQTPRLTIGISLPTPLFPSSSPPLPPPSFKKNQAFFGGGFFLPLLASAAQRHFTGDSSLGLGLQQKPGRFIISKRVDREAAAASDSACACAWCVCVCVWLVGGGEKRRRPHRPLLLFLQPCAGSGEREPGRSSGAGWRRHCSFCRGRGSGHLAKEEEGLR